MEYYQSMGGQQSSTGGPESYQKPQVKQRTINAKLKSQLTKTELAQIKDIYQKYQEQGLLPYLQFKIHVLGNLMPDYVSLAFYQMFSTTKVVQLLDEVPSLNSESSESLDIGMSLQDLEIFYAVFSSHAELDQVAYYLIKFKPGSLSFSETDRKDINLNDNISHEEFIRFVKGSMMMGMTTTELQMLYKKLEQCGLSTGPQVYLSKDQFLKAFQQLKDLPIFAWLFQVMDGVRTNFLNFDESETKGGKSYSGNDERRLTMESIARMRSMIQKDTSLSNEELSLIKEFYDRELVSRDGKYVLKVLNKMFRNIENKTLRQKFVNSVVQKSQTSRYEYLCRLAQLICKGTDDEEDKITFLFEIFSGFQTEIKRQGMKDFADVFMLPPTIFPLNGSSVTLDDFLNLTEDADIDFELYEVCKPMLMAMMAITPSSDLEEKEAIFAALNCNRSVESYIYENFTDELEQFYICDLKFWEHWCASVNFGKEESLGLKLDHKQLIQNSSLIEQRHNFRLKESVEFMTDYLLLPKFVFWPLSKWYACDKVIERVVISHKAAANSRRSSVQGGIFKNEGLRSSYAQKFIVSGQKFHKKSNTDDLDNDYQKRVGELVYEIEVNPKIFYLAPVNSLTGELSFRGLVQNRKVDQSQLSKVLKLNALPFDELQMSRLTTFQQVINIAARQAKQNPKHGRLHVDGVLVQGVQLSKTFEDFGLLTGAMIHYEFLNQLNEWPSEKNKEQLKVTSENNQTIKLSAGLANLGNTCYMNSALQLFANLAPIFDYYVKEQRYQKQINRTSQSGFKGKLVHNFGMLMNQMWHSSSKGEVVVRPRSFKKCIGVCSEQFENFDQQDSQEFLSFLIDSLHEEQNLRLKKPYIVNPDSNGRSISLLGLEAWSNALRRDWSFPFFLFYGQMRSSLVCKTCSTESSTFDLFSNVPLSLPEPTQVTVNVIVYRLPNKVKDIINGLIRKDQDGNYQGRQVDESEQSQQHQSVSSSHYRNDRMQSTRERAQLQNFTDSYNYSMNDQPIRVHVKVESEIEVRQLMQKITKIRETNLEIKLLNTEMVMFALNPISNTVRQILGPDLKLSSLDYQCLEFHCIEVLSSAGREKVRQFYKNNPSFLAQKPDSCLTILAHASSRDELGQYQKQKSQPGLDQSADSSDSQQLQQPYFDKFTYFEQLRRKVRMARTPSELIIVCYHRRFVKKDGRFPPVQPQIISQPFVLTLTSNPSGRRIYDEVWTFASKLIKQNSKLHRPIQRWWERKDWAKSIEKGQICKPFIIKTVTLNGFNCSKCHWTLRCSGCIIEPTDPPVFVDNLSETLALSVDWHFQTLTDNYNPQVSEVIEHSSVSQEQEDSLAALNYTSLDDCLAKFHKPELLENEMRCKKCADLTPHLKKLEIFMPPPVLIIQLKRFRQIGFNWRKVQTRVDFPLRNLDVTTFVTDQNILQEMGIESKYSLHGTINHYGSISAGHYTSCVKNHFDKKWYTYDDNECNEVGNANIEKENAYILFYIRNDVPVKSIDDLFPNIESAVFPGRPIVKKDGQKGFIVKTTPLDLLEAKFEGQNTVETISPNDLLPEPDRNQISSNEGQSRVSNFEESVGAEDEGIKSKKTGCCSMFQKNRSSKVQQSKPNQTDLQTAAIKQNSGQISHLQNANNDRSAVPLDTSILDRTLI